MKSAILIVLFLFVSACSMGEGDNADYYVESNEVVLGERVVYSNEIVNVQNDQVVSKLSNREVASIPVLTKVATVGAPEYNGITLQANFVSLVGNVAFVSYNVKGEEFLGGIDVIDITNINQPKLVSSIVFSDSDLYGMEMDGGSLYVAGASDDPALATPAVLKRIEITGLKIGKRVDTIDIKSFAATGVAVSQSHIYVTSGADGGYLTQLDKISREVVSETPVDDARGVASNGRNLAVVAGTNARLLVYDLSTESIVGDHLYDGASIPESKSTIEMIGGKALMGLGDGGVQIACLEQGSLINVIPAPLVDGLDQSVTVTNAVSADHSSLFVSNGEAGVYLYRSVSPVTADNCIDPDFQFSGKLQLEQLQSINHVTYRNNLLFVAAGTGGLSLIRVDE